jgi:hypothetical protein
MDAGRRFLVGLVVLLFACAAALAGTQAQPVSAEEPATAATAAVADGDSTQWPLRFASHSFVAHTYDTWGARVVYAGVVQLAEADDRLQPPASQYGPDYRRGWRGSHVGIANFPPPARVQWRSRDGTPLSAEVDIAAIFADGLVRHEVPRETVRTSTRLREPSIVLEVNDRTINVYMISTIPLRVPRTRDNPYSTNQRGTTLVHSRTY